MNVDMESNKIILCSPSAGQQTAHRHNPVHLLEIQDALISADVRGLQHQESTMGIRFIWDIHVPGVQRQAQRAWRASQLCQVHQAKL
jgi:hypothetical protein